MFCCMLYGAYDEEYGDEEVHEEEVKDEREKVRKIWGRTRNARRRARAEREEHEEDGGVIRRRSR